MEERRKIKSYLETVKKYSETLTMVVPGVYASRIFFFIF